jgi:two-component system, OmpR family, heavy metal sensor histidine kinase CusS
MNPVSIRMRLAGWYLGVLLAAFILLGGGTWIALRHELLSSLDDSLAANIAGLSRFLDRESRGDDLAAILHEAREYTSAMPHGYRLRLFGTDGSLLLAFPPAAPPGAMFEKRQDISVRGHHLTVEFSAPLEPIDETLSLLRHVLVICVPIVLLVAGFGGWWLSRTALEPVDRMTATAESISMHDLSARLPVPRTGDELERFGEAWNRMLGRVANSVEGMRRFTTDAAHELRTPVAIIRSTAELALRRDRDAVAYRTALATIGEEAVHLSELVADLLWLARNDAGSVKFNFEDVEMAEIVNSVWRSIKPLAHVREIALRTELQISPDLKVCADRGALRRVLLILADNAIKFTPAGGTVTIRLRAFNESCLLEVVDSGAGIAAEDLQFIFDRFYCGDPARNKSGFGLGLSIAHAIIKAHGGRIGVQSVAGGGSSFQIALPFGGSRSPLPELAIARHG